MLIHLKLLVFAVDSKHDTWRDSYYVMPDYDTCLKSRAALLRGDMSSPDLLPGCQSSGYGAKSVPNLGYLYNAPVYFSVADSSKHRMKKYTFRTIFVGECNQQ